MCWVAPMDQRIFFESWIEVRLRRARKKEWWLVFFWLFGLFGSVEIIAFLKQQHQEKEALEMAKLWFEHWIKKHVSQA